MRPDHQDISEGGLVGEETVGIDELFSNGLDYPQEPNCRCVVTFSEEPV